MFVIKEGRRGSTRFVGKVKQPNRMDHVILGVYGRVSISNHTKINGSPSIYVSLRRIILCSPTNASMRGDVYISLDHLVQ